MTLALNPTDLLIAPPNMPDPRFRDSVLMLTHHDDQGAHGLCVNKPLGRDLDHILRHANMDCSGLPPMPVYWGGPVSNTSIWMLHSADWVCSQTVMITSVWAMTSSEEMFHCLASHDMPRHFRLFMGYASWAPGQLDQEIEGQGSWRKEQSWLTAQNLGPEWLFEQPVEDLWSGVVTLSCHQAVDSWL
jgi:putative transcriptional regulator